MKMSESPKPLVVQTIDKLSPWECKYLLTTLDLPFDLKRALAFRFGVSSYYMCNERHARSIDNARRTKKGRFYVREICKCDQTCVNAMLALRAENLSYLDNLELMLIYIYAFSKFCLAELPLNHIFFEKVLDVPDPRRV